MKYAMLIVHNLERMSDDDLVKHGNVQLSFCVDFSVFPLSTTVPQSFADNMSLNSTQQYLRRPVAYPNQDYRQSDWFG